MEGDIKGIFYDTLAKLQGEGYLINEEVRSEILVYFNKLLGYRFDKGKVDICLDVLYDGLKNIKDKRDGLREMERKVGEMEENLISNVNCLADEMHKNDEENIHKVKKIGGIIVLGLEEKVKK